MIRERPRVLLVESGAGDATALGRRLRDDGLEVVYAGPLRTVDEILRTVEQEDPDVLGVVGEPPDGLEAALGDVRLFVAETGAEPPEWLSGGRSHTARTPSDRAR